MFYTLWVVGLLLFNWGDGLTSLLKARYTALFCFSLSSVIYLFSAQLTSASSLVYLGFNWCPSGLHVNLSDNSYSRGNRLTVGQSTHLTFVLAPRCRLNPSFGWNRLFGRRAHPTLGYASWVQNDENQFGLYLLLVLILAALVREDRAACTLL